MANTERRLFQWLRLRQRWICFVVPLFCTLLLISLSQFLGSPDRRMFGVAWNALFQIFAPTLGSTLIMLLVVSEAHAKRLSVIAAGALISMVVITSAICLYWSFPILMSV